MTTTRPFAADRNKLAYAQAFSRTSTPLHHAVGPRPSRAALRSVGALAARLHRPARPAR